MKNTAAAPDIIFIFADQMRASSLGCMELENVLTPNLDKFAEEGTLFERAISNHPVCCPARATIMTGLHSVNHGLVVNDQQIRTELPTIAKGLNSIGYKCGYIGKWHMDCGDRGIFIPPGPRRLGFDDFWAAYNCNHSYMNAYYYLNDNPEPVWIDGYEPFAQTDLAMHYIGQKSKEDSPYCLFLSFGTPHCPYNMVPEEYKDMYPADDIKLKPNAPESADKNVISGYYAHITALDECFGRILDAVENSGRKDNTLIIFTSDHGDMLFSHNRGWKMKPWLEAVNIPFIVRWPGRIPAGRRSNAPIGLVDIMPTLLGIAGAKAPESIDGTDLSELFYGNEESAPDYQLISNVVSYRNYSIREWRGIVTRTHSYATLRDEDMFFFNDSNDIHQLNNLKHDHEYSALLEEHRKLLKEALEKVGDPFLSSEEATEKYVIDKLVVSPDKEELIPYIKQEYAECCDFMKSKRPGFEPDPPVDLVTSIPNKLLNTAFFENRKIREGKTGKGRVLFHNIFTAKRG